MKHSYSILITLYDEYHNKVTRTKDIITVNIDDNVPQNTYNLNLTNVQRTMFVNGSSTISFSLDLGDDLKYINTNSYFKITIYTSLYEASKSLTNGQTLFIGSGTYFEPIVIKSNDVTVIGSGHVKIDGATADGKGAIVTKGSNITIYNIECMNITVPDNNGACIRSEGLSLEVDHVYFHDSQQGILSNSDTQLVNITNSRFENLGKNGQAHGIYIGGGELNIVNSIFIASIDEGHEIKSRAKKTSISRSIIASLSAKDSHLVDIPHGGELIIENCILEQGPNSSNVTAVGYSLERGRMHKKQTIKLLHNLIILERKRGNRFLNMSKLSNPLIKIKNNTFISTENNNVFPGNTYYKNREDASINPYPFIPPPENNRW